MGGNRINKQDEQRVRNRLRQLTRSRNEIRENRGKKGQIYRGGQIAPSFS